MACAFEYRFLHQPCTSAVLTAAPLLSTQYWRACDHRRYWSSKHSIHTVLQHTLTHSLVLRNSSLHSAIVWWTQQKKTCSNNNQDHIDPVRRCAMSNGATTKPRGCQGLPRRLPHRFWANIPVLYRAVRHRHIHTDTHILWKSHRHKSNFLLPGPHLDRSSAGR